jgi:hypothetical protein
VDQRGSPAAASSSWRLGVSTARGSLAGERERGQRAPRMSGEAAVGAAGRSSQALVCVSPPDTRGGRGAGAVGEGEGASTRRQRPAGQHEDQKTRLPRPGVGCSSLSLLPLRCVCFGCAPADRGCRRLGEVKGFVIASVREREEGRSAASLSLFSLCSRLHWFLFYPPVLFDLRVGPLLSFFSTAWYGTAVLYS